MPKLSDTQLIVLAAAVARDDGFAVIPDKMNAGAASKVGWSLVTRKLMREVKAKPDMPVWYRDDEGRGLTLVITAAGRKAIDAEAPTEAKPAANAKTKRGEAKAAFEAGGLKAPQESTKPKATETVAGQGAGFRECSKAALIVKMLSAKNGVTLQAIEDATGWLPHTTRAALTGLRKKGFAIARDRQPGKHSTYRISADA